MTLNLHSFIPILSVHSLTRFIWSRLIYSTFTLPQFLRSTCFCSASVDLDLFSLIAYFIDPLSLFSTHFHRSTHWPRSKLIDLLFVDLHLDIFSSTHVHTIVDSCTFPELIWLTRFPRPWPISHRPVFLDLDLDLIPSIHLLPRLVAVAGTRCVRSRPARRSPNRSRRRPTDGAWAGCTNRWPDLAAAITWRYSTLSRRGRRPGEMDVGADFPTGLDGAWKS